jgi:peptide/nickel transport system permease protein
MSTATVPTTVKAKKASSPLRTAVLAALRRPSVIVSLVWVVLLVVCTTFADQLAPHDPLKQNLKAAYQLPNATYWLGTDNLGRDILSRLMHGGTGILQGALITLAVAILIGVPLGLLAGYFGGWVDQAVSFYVNVLLSLPGFIIIVTIAFVTANNVPLIMTSLGVVFSAGLARIVRGSTQAARNLLYVDSARVSGMGTVRILLRHIFPNVTGPLIVQSFLFLSQAFLILTSLSFLGLGFDPQSPDWGQLVLQATKDIARRPWLMVPIGTALILTVLAFNQIGTGLRESLPHSRKESMLAPLRPRRTDAPANVAASSESAPTLRQAQGSTRQAQDPGSTSSLAEPVEANVLTDPSTLRQALLRQAQDPGSTRQAQGPGSDAPIVEVRNLTVSFPQPSGEIAVVDRVSLAARRGEVLGLVGESGCGKTMTALAILGLVPSPGATTAELISLDGHDLASMPEKERAKLRGTTVAMIGQEPMVALDPCFTVGSALVEALRVNTGLSKADAKTRAVELLSTVGIARVKEVYASYPHQLSGGMAQRVAIALALTGSPKILVADEPTTALDVTIQAEILDLLLDLRDSEGMTILIVTHDLGVVADVCDRVAVMYAGEVIETGTASEVLTSPEHPYTKGLLGAVPDLAGEEKRLAAIPGRVPLPRDWPSGCRFYARCPIRIDACAAAAVPMLPEGSEHPARCLRVDDLVPTGVEER